MQYGSDDGCSRTIQGINQRRGDEWVVKSSLVKSITSQVKPTKGSTMIIWWRYWCMMCLGRFGYSIDVEVKNRQTLFHKSDDIGCWRMMMNVWYKNASESQFVLDYAFFTTRNNHERPGLVFVDVAKNLQNQSSDEYWLNNQFSVEYMPEKMNHDDWDEGDNYDGIVMLHPRGYVEVNNLAEVAEYALHLGLSDKGMLIWTVMKHQSRTNPTSDHEVMMIIVISLLPLIKVNLKKNELPTLVMQKLTTVPDQYFSLQLCPI